MAERENEVIILTSSHNKNGKDDVNKKYKIVYSYSTKKIKGSNLKRFLNNILFGITSFFKSIMLGKVDLVVTTSPPPLISMFGYFIAKTKRANLVYDVRDIWPDVAIEMESFTEKSIYYKVFKFIAKFMYKKSDYITTVSPGKVEKIKNYVSEKQKVKYIPNGLDDNFVNFIVDEKIIKKYNLDTKFTIVYIGNVGLAQNLDALVELANNYKENAKMQFLIFGEGANKENIQNKINKLKLNNIKLKGKIDYNKVYTILKYSKISFIPLKNNKMTDSIPTKIFDALGAGCPVLLLAKGDACKILKESCLGECVENLENLKETFDYMIKNYKEYEDKKSFAIEHVKNNYSRKKIAEKFERNILIKQYEEEI